VSSESWTLRRLVPLGSAVVRRALPDTAEETSSKLHLSGAVPCSNLSGCPTFPLTEFVIRSAAW
jgi:hypothetical protein